MIVTRGNFSEIVQRLSLEPCFSLDTETTGLMVYLDDQFFGISFGTAHGSYYFNFLGYDGLSEEMVLPREWIPKLQPALSGKERMAFLANAKFDLAALAREGLTLEPHVHDVLVAARVEYNAHMSYSLEDVAKRRGLKKLDEVEEYISEHHLWEWRTIPGKKTRVKNKFFYRVPFEIMSRYALQDAAVTYEIGLEQIKSIEAVDFGDDRRGSYGSLLDVMRTECAVTKAVFRMEQVGIAIDPSYCEKAIAYEDNRAAKAQAEFKRLCGFELKDSNKHLAQVFASQNIPVPLTDKQNPSLTDEVLEEIDHPLVQQIRDYRDAQKRANTYYRAFLFRMDRQGVIHPNLKQDGAGTGRFSCAEPNLQNLTSDTESDTPFPVRRAFIPRPGFFFVMLDYDQMEFRLMLDYAGQMDLIRKILAGYDPHQATADLAGISRKAAKTLNFGLLYGMGIGKLAKSLGIDVQEAKRFKTLYFDALPKVQNFLSLATYRARKTGKLRSWAGRLFHYPDPEFAYRGPNSIIQGGCADVVKNAMVLIDALLVGKKSRMLLQVHDELVFEIAFGEEYLVPLIKELMEKAYTARHLPLTCSVSHSLRSLGDPEDGMPTNDAARNQVQESGEESSEGFSPNYGVPLVFQDSATSPPGNP